MRLGEIDLNAKPLHPTFSLCKPDKTVISPLKDISNVELSIKLGKVNELSFTIPSQVERNHNLIDNPLIDSIKHRFLVKMIYNHQTEYFVFLDQNKTYDSSDESISYKLYGLGYLLADKQIKQYVAEGKDLLYIASEILEYTKWRVDYVDAAFSLDNYGTRSHEIESQTILQAVYELADKFNAVLIWDTVNLTISFFQPVNVGTNKGLKFKEGKYLESFSFNTNSEETITRLYVYGKDGLTFRSLTPTGVNFIQDFSWYMYPFERDVNGTVISSSDYMSDSLCIALEEYGLALANAGTQFGTLTTSLKAKQDEIQQAEQELTVLVAQLSVILDELDISNSNGQSNTPAHALIIQRRIAKDAELAAKHSQINTLNAEKIVIQDQITALGVSLQMESFLSAANLLELDSYIIEKDYTNSIIVDEADLLEEGLEAFNEHREPKVNLTLDIVNFRSNIEAQNSWNKISLGDIVKLESARLRAGIEAKIIELNFNFESDSISLTIANEKELKDDYRKLMDLIYSANATSNSVNLNKFKWDMIEEANNLVSQLYFGAIDTIKNNITAGYQQSIEITERGILVRSPNDPMRMLIIQNGVLALSNNGGNTWANAITAQGIIGETIIGRLIMGNRLIIEDEDGIIRFSGSIQEVFDNNGNVRVAIGNYANGKYGMRIDGGSIEIIGDSNNNLVDVWNSAEQNANNYTNSTATTIRSDLRLTAPLPTSLTLNSNGITASSTTDTNKFARMDYRGLYIQNGAIDIRTGTATNRGVIFDGLGIRGYNTNGTQTFGIDTNGNATFSGNLSGATGTFSGSLSGATGTFSGTLSAGTVLSSGYISGGSIYGSTITGSTITGSTINVDTDMWVGRNIRLQGGIGSVDSKGIIFGTESWDARITYGTGGLQFSGASATFNNSTYFNNSIFFNSYSYFYNPASFYSSVNFSNASITWGNNAPNATARFG